MRGRPAPAGPFELERPPTPRALSYQPVFPRHAPTTISGIRRGRAAFERLTQGEPALVLMVLSGPGVENRNAFAASNDKRVDQIHVQICRYTS